MKTIRFDFLKVYIAINQTKRNNASNFKFNNYFIDFLLYSQDIRKCTFFTNKCHIIKNVLHLIFSL